jgi:hypothetical protein
MVGSCEYGNKFSGSIKGMKILEQLSDYRLLNKGLITLELQAVCRC